MELCANKQEPLIRVLVELEWILPIENEEIESHTTLQRFVDASLYMHTRTGHVT